MWSMRILNGPQAGQTISLKEGENRVGRDPSCEIVFKNAGVSKLHAKIITRGNAVAILDLNSSNGTFVNGIRILQQPIGPGDKIGFYDILVDVFPTGLQAQPTGSMAGMTNSQSMQIGSSAGLPAEGDSQNSQQSANIPMTWSDKASKYFDQVALPGVYKLIKISDFNFVLGSFVVGFAVLVTILSVIPMMKITKDSVEKESQNRARTIAKALALANQNALSKGWSAALDISVAEREPGVRFAYIINSRDGTIIAPQNKQGTYVKNQPFVHRARKSDRSIATQIDTNTIGASIPIKKFDPATGERRPHAHAIVIYDMGKLAFDQGRTISLFVQTLAIAIALGLILYVFLYRMTQQPLLELNNQLDQALRDKRPNVETPYKINILKTLVDNINAALNRSSGAGGEMAGGAFQDRPGEASNLIQIMPAAALALDKNLNIIFVNQYFEDLTGMRLATIQSQPLDSMGDQALQLSISDLIERNRVEPHLIATNKLDFNGNDYEIDSQAVLGKEEIEYFIIVLKLTGGEMS